MRDVLVLCYHAVSERWTAPLSVRPELLTSQLDHLLDRGYVGTTFTRAVLDPPARKTLAVTFDDGFRSVLELGLPILAERDLPATMFVVSSFMDGQRPLSWPGISHWSDSEHHGELAALGIEELRHLSRQGWEIGSHTCTHPRLADQEGGAIEEELSRSKRDLEGELGLAIQSVAYPYGSTDPRVEAVASQLYEAAAGLPAKAQRARAFSWPRIGVYQGDTLSRFRLKCARSVRAARLLLPGQILGR